MEKKRCPMCRGTGVLVELDPEELRRLREETGQSLRSLAEKLGYSPAYLSEIERGLRKGNFDILNHYRKMTTSWTKEDDDD